MASEIWPSRAARIMLSGLNSLAGLSRSIVETPIGPVHYLEGGTGETVVFLHGIFALKEHWVDMSRQVSGDYHVILLDLPGFGENPRLDAGEYDYTRQAQNVMNALDQIGVDKFHVAANSMGAQIAGQLATKWPERIRSVAFIGSPVGVTSPIESDMERALSDGEMPLVVTSETIYADRMQWLFPNVPFIPRPIIRSWSASEVAYADLNFVIWDEVSNSQVPPLEDIAPRIAQPSLIVWCDKDRIFHVSGAHVLDAALPNSNLIIAEDCGHLPMLDRTNETGRDFLAFLNAQG